MWECPGDVGGSNFQGFGMRMEMQPGIALTR